MAKEKPLAISCFFFVFGDQMTSVALVSGSTKTGVHMRPGGHMKSPPVMTARTARQGQRVPQESCSEWKVPEWVY